MKIIISWPLTGIVLGLAFLFIYKKPLYNKISSLKEITIKKNKAGYEFAVKFRDKLSKLTKDAKIFPNSLENINSTAILEYTAELSSRAAIMESWRDFEYILLSYAKTLGLFDSNSYQYINYREILGKLEQSFILTKENMAIINKLRKLRDAVAHSTKLITQELTQDDAKEYIYLLNQQSSFIAAAAIIKRQKGKSILNLVL